MTDYAKGHVKRNADTGEVAVRTQFPVDRTPRLAGMAWLVASTNIGARNAHTDEVSHWPDLFIPDGPEFDPTAPPVEPEPPVEEPTE